MITEIVVLGGGYTGVWAARAAAGAGARVRLVAADPDHSFHGWTAEVITGHVRPERARVPLADLLPGVEIVLGRVESVSLAQQSVRVATDHGHPHLAYAEPVAAHRLHHVGDAGGYQRVAHGGIEGAVDPDTRGRLADRAGQHCRFLQGKTLGDPDRAQPDAFCLKRLVDAAARSIDPAGEGIGAELVAQRLRAWLLRHAVTPCEGVACVSLFDASSAH